MAWTNPADKTTGDVVTAASWNALLGTTGSLAQTSAAKVTTAGDIAYATAANTLTRLGIGSTGQVLTVTGGLPVWASPSSSTIKYKTTTQVITTSTTLVDVIAAGSPATMSFSIGASEVWQATWYLPLSFGGTGGAKFQLTGPASPTAVTITGQYVRASTAAGGGFTTAFTAVTAFASDIASLASAAGVASDSAYVNNSPCFIEIVATIRNGSNAGTVTLQAAQNNANSTTTIGLGAYMEATKAA